MVIWQWWFDNGDFTIFHQSNEVFGTINDDFKPGYFCAVSQDDLRKLSDSGVEGPPIGSQDLWYISMGFHGCGPWWSTFWFQHLSGRREVPQSPTQRVPANILKAREVANSGTSGWEAPRSWKLNRSIWRWRGIEQLPRDGTASKNSDLWVAHWISPSNPDYFYIPFLREKWLPIESSQGVARLWRGSVLL